jgi:hypothetical protein
MSASWADYDNDGWLDVFICCERQASRLYHNRQDGTFEEVGIQAGVAFKEVNGCKGAAWFDYDNDDYPDLFQNYLHPHFTAKLFHNKRDGTFEEATYTHSIDGPHEGFSCWAWDYDNDGWLDIFATSYDRTLSDAVKDLVGLPTRRHTSRLYHNVQGQKFEDLTKQAALDGVYVTMGSNFGDIDNDGFLDFYLGTGDPDLATLLPNRMFKNVGGKRFSDVTASSGTGNLQKGHGVAWGDWDHDGDNDMFIEMGGAIPGDKYHNILFQNPGHGNNSITLKLIGMKTNKPAIGARIKVVGDGPEPLTVHRHISSGSSFGGNPMEQTIGLAKSGKISVLEIHWPTSGTTQVFHDVDVNQALEITEFQSEYRVLDRKPIAIRE